MDDKIESIENYLLALQKKQQEELDEQNDNWKIL